MLVLLVVCQSNMNTSVPKIPSWSQARQDAEWAQKALLANYFFDIVEARECA